MNLTSKKFLMVAFLVVSTVACGGGGSTSPDTSANDNGSGVSKPEKPGDSIKPGEPGKPGDSIKPGDTGEPEEPSVPLTPKEAAEKAEKDAKDLLDKINSNKEKTEKAEKVEFDKIVNSKVVNEKNLTKETPISQETIRNRQDYRNQMVTDDKGAYDKYQGHNKGYVNELSNESNKPLNIKNKSITLKLNDNAFIPGEADPNDKYHYDKQWDGKLINTKNVMSKEDKHLTIVEVKELIPKRYYQGVSRTSILGATDGGKINLQGENELKIEGKSGYENVAIRVGFGSELVSDKLSIETDGIATGGIDIYGGGKVTLKDSTKIKAKGIGSYGISVGKSFNIVEGYSDKTMKNLIKEKGYYTYRYTPLSGTLIAKNLRIESDFHGIISNSSNMENDITTIKIDGLKIKSGLAPININSNISKIELKDAELYTEHSNNLIKINGDHTELTLKGNTRLLMKDGIAINIDSYKREDVEPKNLDKNYKEDFKHLKDSLLKNTHMLEDNIDTAIKNIYTKQINYWQNPSSFRDGSLSEGSLILKDNTYVEGSVLFPNGIIRLDDRTEIKLKNNNRISAIDLVIRSKDAKISVTSDGKSDYSGNFNFNINGNLTSQGTIDLQNSRTDDILRISGNYLVPKGEESTLKLDFKFYDKERYSNLVRYYSGDKVVIEGKAEGKTNVEFKNLGKANLDGFEITNEMAKDDLGFNIIEVKGNAEHANFNLKGDVTAGAFTYKLEKIDTPYYNQEKAAKWSIVSDKVPLN